MPSDPPVEAVDILLVDDTPENILALKSILERPDYNLICASNGTDALKLVLKHDFAAILLDVLMPGLNGFETASLIRERDKSRHVPILFLTAHGGDVSLIYRGYSVGAVDYLIKPIVPDVVKAKVAVFVELFRKSRQIERQQAELRQAEQRRAASALRESEAQYDVTFDQAAVGIAHVGLDGRCIKANQHFSKLSGYSKEQALKLDVKEFFHPDEAERDLQALTGLKSNGAGPYVRETRFDKQDGSVLWVSLTASLIHDSSGAPKRYILIVEDVSDRRRAQRRQAFLSSASERLLASIDYEATLAAVTQIAVPMLADWCVIDVAREGGSSEGLSAVHADPAKTEAVCELLRQLRADVDEHDANEGELARYLARVLRTGLPDLVESLDNRDLADFAGDESTLELLRKVGLNAAMIVPLIARSGTLGTLVLASATPGQRYDALDLAMACDLAQRAAFAIDNARLYKKSLEAVRVREEFLSIASHELRTPLSPLLLQIESMRADLKKARDGTYDLDRLERKAERAEAQIYRLQALVETLLDVSRLATQKLRLKLEDHDLRELVAEVVGRFSDAAARAKCTLRLQGEGPIPGRWDRLRIEQLVTNLISNAIKYGGGQPIEVCLAQNDGHVSVSVKDHGIGIPEDKQKKIFQRFERAVAAENYGGLGLGLYIASQIAEAHGGQIEVTSEIGNGSLFTVSLPLRALTTAPVEQLH